MASKYSSSEIFDICSDKIQFQNWNEGEPEAEFVAHAKKVALLALQNELTEKQRMYYTMYCIDDLSVSEIAELTGVNKSSVSKALTRAEKRLHKVLRYSAPHLINV